MDNNFENIFDNMTDEEFENMLDKSGITYIRKVKINHITIKEYYEEMDKINKEINNLEKKRGKLNLKLESCYVENNISYQNLKHNFIELNPKYTIESIPMIRKYIFIMFTKCEYEKYGVMFYINDEDIIIETHETSLDVKLPKGYYKSDKKGDFTQYYYKNE